jgi:hypothetical protein
MSLSVLGILVFWLNLRRRRSADLHKQGRGLESPESQVFGGKVERVEWSPQRYDVGESDRVWSEWKGSFEKQDEERRRQPESNVLSMGVGQGGLAPHAPPPSLTRPVQSDTITKAYGFHLPRPALGSLRIYTGSDKSGSSDSRSATTCRGRDGDDSRGRSLTCAGKKNTSHGYSHTAARDKQTDATTLPSAWRKSLFRKAPHTGGSKRYSDDFQMIRSMDDVGRYMIPVETRHGDST